MTLAAEVVGNVLVVALAAVSWVFVTYYFLRARWEESAVGRGLMAFVLIVALMMTLGLVRIVFGEPAWFIWLRMGLFLCVVVLFAGALVLLVRTQREARHRRPKHRTKE